jgi:hypothetical protein
MKKSVLIGIIIVIVILVIVGIFAYSWMNNTKKGNSCSIMDNSKCNKKCNIDSDCKKAGCSCINNLETMNMGGGSCNTLVAFSCKCENNICISDSTLPNYNQSVCGDGICETGEDMICPTKPCVPNEPCPSCAVGSCPKDCDSDYKCPTVRGIDCMPPVKTENIQYCSGAYHNWIAQNCNVSFTY